MDKSGFMALCVVLLVVLLALMLLGWSGRRRRQQSLPSPRRLAGDPGRPVFESAVHYVATTTAGDPLDRVAVGGLGFRARAVVSVTGTGVVLTIPGQHPFWFPAADLRGVDRSTWTIDRVVERDGLVLLAWNLVADSGDAVPVDTYLRFDTSPVTAEFISAVHSLLAPTGASTTSSPQGGNA